MGSQFIQNGMPMRLSKELFHEAPTDAHILWTYQSPWKDARLRHNVSSARVLLNHIPGTNVLTRKLLLPRLLRSESLTSLAPLTFLLPQERARFETARVVTIQGNGCSKERIMGTYDCFHDGAVYIFRRFLHWYRNAFRHFS